MPFQEQIQDDSIANGSGVIMGGNSHDGQHQQPEEDMMGLYDDNDVVDEAETETEIETEAEAVQIAEIGTGPADKVIMEDSNASANASANTSSSAVVNNGGDVTNTPAPPPEAATESPLTTAETPGPTKERTPPVSATVSAPAPAPATKPSSAPPSSTVKIPTKSASNAPQNDIEALNDEIATLLLTNKITLTTSSKLQSMLRENVSLKEKITKLKTLLSRSSKASKETKIELDKAQREVARLSQRVESLANRPTHMDLLADFETNFDRALMSLHSGKDVTSSTSSSSSAMNGGGGGAGAGIEQQSGEDTRPPMLSTSNSQDGENVSTLLMNELSRTKQRMEQLESLNTQLVHKSSLVHRENEQYVSQLERQALKMSNLQLELRMAKMETENATREMKAKTASLSEMQMEIDLVTRSAMNANVRAAEGMEVAKTYQSDKAQVDELKAQVAALQEWAMAAAEAKEVIVEENKLLEQRLDELESLQHNTSGSGGGSGSTSRNGINGFGGGDDMNPRPMTTLRSDNVSPRSKDKITERKLWTKSSSVVIGAGTSECHVIELGENQVMDFETVILRWKFDITPGDVDIFFSMLKGAVDGRDKNAVKGASALINQRRVLGGGGGEVQGAFVIQDACTLLWSNEHSWVRPRTIVYVVEAFAVM